MRLKFPAFKVTQRTAASSTVRRNLPRSWKCESAPAQSSSGIEEGVPDFVSMMEEGPHACSVPEVSLHAVKEKAAATAWARVRPALLKIAVEGNAMPSDQSCIMCPGQPPVAAFSVHLGPSTARTALNMSIPASTYFTLEKYGK